MTAPEPEVPLETAPELSEAELLAGEFHQLDYREISSSQWERVQSAIREAIDKGFTGKSKAFMAPFTSQDYENSWLELASILFDEVLNDVERLPEGPLAVGLSRLKRTHLTFLPAESWSAMSLPVGDSYLIAIDQQIPMVLYFLAKIMVLNWTVRTGETHIKIERVIERDEIPNEVLTRLLRCYFGSGQIHGSFQFPTAILNTEGQLDFALRATLQAEKFMIHHEAQHITLQHWDADSEPVDPPLLNSTIRSEIEADAGAVVLTFSKFIDHELDDNDHSELVIILCGMRLLFEAQDLVERSYFQMRPPSHPSAQDRYDIIMESGLRAWLPADTLRVSDALTSMLAEICNLIRNFEPRPKPSASLRDVMHIYPCFSLSEDAARWATVDDVEETIRGFAGALPQHLAELTRKTDTPSFSDQRQSVQLSVELQVLQLYGDFASDPAFLAGLRQYEDTEDPDPNELRRYNAELFFDMTWGARILHRVLGPALKKIRKAADSGKGLTSDQLTSWVKSCVPPEAVFPGVAVLHRMLRDPVANVIIAGVAAQDLTGLEKQLMTDADTETSTSFVTAWAYISGPLAHHTRVLSEGLAPSATDLLSTWLLEADEAILRFSTDAGEALSKLYQRAKTAADSAIQQGNESGSDMTTAYLRMIVTVKPRHARLCEATLDDDPKPFQLMLDLLPIFKIISGPYRTLNMAMHLGTKAAERGWVGETNQVVEFLEQSPYLFPGAAAQLKSLMQKERPQNKS